MAQKTLEEVLKDVGAYVDQDTTLPSGTELTVRANFVNQALDEWQNAYEWKRLRQHHTVSFAFSGTSTALPSNFKRLMTPLYDESKESGNRYVELDPDERFNRSSSEQWCRVGGNDASGLFLEFSPAMASGASLVFDYQMYASSMATLQDISVCPNSNFLVKWTQGAILEARSDPRFPQVKADASRLLFTMIEEEAAPTGGQNNRIPTWTRRPHDNQFIIGEDG